MCNKKLILIFLRALKSYFIITKLNITLTKINVISVSRTVLSGHPNFPGPLHYWWPRTFSGSSSLNTLHTPHRPPSSSSPMAALSRSHRPLRPSAAAAPRSPPVPLPLRKLFFPSFSPSLPAASSAKPAALQPLRARRRCMCQMNPQTAEASVAEADDRPPFDLNLAVLLAGFAFEAYSSPPVSHPCF